MRTLSTVTPKGVCRGCGVLIATTKTGAILQHDRPIDGFDDETPIKILVQCPGAGKAPKGKDE